MANLNLGNVAIVPKGVWSSTSTYEKLNTVTYNGSSFMAIKPVPAGTLTSDTSYWQMIAAKGDIGDTGAAATVTKSYLKALFTPISLSDFQKSEHRNYIDAAKAITMVSPASPIASVYPEKDSFLYPTMYVDAIQTGTGDPSPDNIRPIVGVNNVNALRCGINLLDESTLEIGGLAGATGNPYVATDRCRTGFIMIKPGSYYVLTDFTINNRIVYDKNYNFIRSLSDSGSVISVPENAAYLRIAFVIDDGLSLDVVKSHHFMLVQGSTAPITYTFYNGSTYPIALSTIKDSNELDISTQYGGYIDWKRKKWVKTHGVKVFDGTENFTMYTSGNINRFSYSLGAKMNSVCACTHFAYQLNAVDLLNKIWVSATGTTCAFTYAATSTVEFKAALSAQYSAGTPVIVVHELITPVEYDLDLSDISAIEGINNLYHDGNGNISVEYKADMYHLISVLSARVTALEAAATQA